MVSFQLRGTILNPIYTKILSSKAYKDALSSIYEYIF